MSKIALQIQDQCSIPCAKAPACSTDELKRMLVTSNRLLTVLMTLAAPLLFLAGCKKQLESVQPGIEKITESVYASGIIKSKHQYQVFSSVNGLLQKIWVSEGDLIQSGAPLFTIENENARLQLDNAQLAADFAELSLRGERLDELSTAIQTAKSKMLNDSLLLQRQRSLWAQQIGSKAELEQRELAYISSAGNYEAARLRYLDLKKQLDFSAAQTRKQLAISQKNARDFTVYSKIGGRVYSILKEEGEMVNTQTPLAILGDAGDFLIELQIDENDIVRLKTGQRVFLTLSSYPGQVFEAGVADINPIMNERSRTFTVEAVFTQKPPVLYPNLTAEANIVILEKEKAMTIPRAYLIGDSAVMLTNKTLRRVETGLKDYQKVEILRGLAATETILLPEK
ncbi:MAG: efflux RND transporter periplasmic adaptor subunit [Saprospiraceae bacterium]|nr:efflux RND transporter periplasmic adaptor subunit [Saprospiraceae bacterium]